MAVLLATSYYQGAWVNIKDRYLGFAFKIGEKIHFGWARLSTQHFCYECTAVIQGYAYETIPGKPIVAGDEGNVTEASLEPAGLGMLALGAPGVSLWRRESQPETGGGAHRSDRH
jgi:hypothetical protein